MPHPARRLLRAIRPAEWVVLLFAGGLLVRYLRSPFPLEGDFPRADLVAAWIAVLFARQLLRYRQTPWPEDSTFARAHWLLFPFALAPLVGQVLLFATGRDLFMKEGGRLARTLFALDWMAERTAALGLPLLLLWLGLGLHLKREGRVNLPRLARDGLGGAFSTLRAWAPPVLLILAYSMLRGVLESAAGHDQDAAMLRFDTWLCFGHDPHQALQHLASAPLSEWMAFCYVAYAALYPLAFGLVAALAWPRGFEELAFAVTLTLALGYLCYPLVPVQGPMFAQHFTVSLDGYYFQWVKDQLLDRYRVPRDCFPSLHTAVSLVFLWGLRRHARRAFWLFAPVAGFIPLACIYLRYHYIADVLAGTALATAVAWATPRVLARYEAWRERPEPGAQASPSTSAQPSA